MSRRLVSKTATFQLSYERHPAPANHPMKEQFMSETLSETRACDLLTRLFRSRGYVIERNTLFREYGVEFHADGWDPKARVGFEFLSSEDDDHDDLSLAEYNTLSDAHRRGELSLFIIDEVEPLSAADLLAEAGEFLDEIASAAEARKKRANRGTKAAVKKKPAPKPALKKKAVGKKRAVIKKKVAAKKAATKKPVKTATKRAAKKKR